MLSHADIIGFQYVAMLLLTLSLCAWVMGHRAKRHVRAGGHPSEQPVTAREMWTSFWAQFWHELLHGNPTFTIILSGFLTMAVGLHLINPAFDTFGPSSSYGSLNRTPFGEMTWGVSLFAIGLGKWILLALNGITSRGFYPATYYAAALLNAFMSVVWINIAFGILVSDASGFGYYTYAVFSFLSLWAATRRFRVARGGS